MEDTKYIGAKSEMKLVYSERETDTTYFTYDSQ